MFPAERITKLRIEKGITKAELAQFIHVSRSSISEYEKGVTQPSLTVLMQIADFFEVSLDYLLGRTDIKIPIDQLENQLSTRSGKIPINAIFRLSNDEKEVIALLLKTYLKHN